VRNFAGSHLFEDVYTFNDFVHHGTSVALQSPDRVRRQARRFRQPDSRFRKAPYLVTEHNGHMFPTKTTDPEARRTEHALRHLRVLDAMYRHRHISGAIGWCMADYNTHRDFGSGDRICHHGVLDMYRLPKTAAAVYASQQDGQPFLHVSSTMNIGDHDAASLPEVQVFTNCDAVVLYRNGESIGSFRPDSVRYKGLPHPPVVIRDFVGDRLERREGFSHRNAEGLKRVMRQVMATGGALNLRVRLAMGWQMLKNRLSYERAVALFGEYMGNWGGKSVEWRFEGIRNGVPVCSAKAGAAPDGGLHLEADRLTLEQAETWDACRIVIRHADGWEQPCTYSREVVHVQVAGAGRLLGPSSLALTGGAAAFWVRTNGQTGDVRVQVLSERYGTNEVVLTAMGKETPPKHAVGAEP
jgi:beta-galactosidase